MSLSTNRGNADQNKRQLHLIILFPYKRSYFARIAINVTAARTPWRQGPLTFLPLQVEGLPGLILCSGVVVAAGREPFRRANYMVQRTLPPAAVLEANRLGLRKLKAFNRKFMQELFSLEYYYSITIIINHSKLLLS